MLHRFANLESIRGRATRVFISTDVPPFGVRAVWPCGCIATGPSLDQLIVNDLACLIHRSERSQTTLILRRP
jgi:hypothetical protein